MQDALSRFSSVYHPRFSDLAARVGLEEMQGIYVSCEWWTLILRTYLGDKASSAREFRTAVIDMRTALTALVESTLLQPRQVEEAVHSFEGWVSRASPHQSAVMQELASALATEKRFMEPTCRDKKDPLLALPLPKFENGGDDHWQLPF